MKPIKGKTQESYSQHLIFIVTYKRAKKVRVLNYTRLEKLASDKHSSLLGRFVSYKENVLLFGPWPSPQIKTRLERPDKDKHSRFL